MKPTEEQIKKLWEWCGFKYLGKHLNYTYADEIEVAEDLWEWPDGNNYFALPGINSLDNLFKYAVPKLKELDLRLELALTTVTDHDSWRSGCGFNQKYTWLCDIYDAGYKHNLVRTVDESDPAIALFNAIYKVIKEAE